MAAPVIQVDYDRLAEVARGFERNAETAAAMHKQVQRNALALRQGGWEGRGFAAFCAEMDGVVLPAMRRLHAALGQAQTVTLKIAEVARQAEEEAAEPFKARDQVTIPLGSVTAGGVAAGVLGVASAGAGQTGLFAPTTDGSSKLTASLMADVDGDCGSGIGGLFCRIGRAIGDFFRSIFGGGSAELDPATPTGRTSVPPSEADAIFRDMADESDIPFRFPADGCYARSHLMVMRMAERYGLNLDINAEGYHRRQPNNTYHLHISRVERHDRQMAVSYSAAVERSQSRWYHHADGDRSISFRSSGDHRRMEPLHERSRCHPADRGSPCLCSRLLPRR